MRQSSQSPGQLRPPGASPFLSRPPHAASSLREEAAHSPYLPPPASSPITKLNFDLHMLDGVAAMPLPPPTHGAGPTVTAPVEVRLQPPTQPPPQQEVKPKIQIRARKPRAASPGSGARPAVKNKTKHKVKHSAK